MQKVLADGLIVRSLSDGCVQDRERLVPFYKQIFSEAEEWSPETDDPWAHGLIDGEHPTMTDDDIWVVVDPQRDDMLVSTLLLIPQTWRYDTLEIPVGRPELVATHPEYRRRGLVRALFDICHARSAECGHILQGITGIPHFYRRFGYTMGVELGRGGGLPISSVPELKDKPAQFTLRPATTDDIPVMIACDEYLARQFALSVVRGATMWSFDLRRPFQPIQVIQAADGRVVGYVVLHREGKSPWLNVYQYIVGPQASYLATYDDVLRGIKAYAERTYATDQQPDVHRVSHRPPTGAVYLDRQNGGGQGR
jgi:GNAT superfamily N-acetyltransferase